MRIRELPLDPQVVTQLEGEGLDQLYPPQEDAIKAGVLDGKNLVLASPTASGKTLVAEICILKHVLERNGKAIYLAPLRALASEKYKEFQRYSSIKKPNGEHLRIGMSTGDYDSSDPWLGRYDIIISTNEKCLGQDEEVVVISGGEVDILKISDLFSIVSANGNSLSNGSMINSIPKDPLFTIGLNVETWEPEISQIECVSKIRDNKDPLHTLSLESGRTVALTSDHPVFTVERGELRKVRAAESEGKTTVCLRDVSRIFKGTLESINLMAELQRMHVISTVKGVFNSDFSPLVAPLKRRGLTERRAKERAKYYCRQRVAPLSILLEAGLRDAVTSLVSLRAPKNRNALPARLALTEELGKLVGYVISEGKVTLSSSSANSRIWTTSKEILADLEQCARRLGISYCVYHEAHKATEFRISSKLVYHLLRDVFRVGDNAGSKVLPPFFLCAADDFVRGLLTALFDGDGGISPTAIEYATKNRKLALQLSLLLARFDVHTKIYASRATGYPGLYWRVAVMGGKNVERLSRLISPVRPKIKVGLARLSTARNRRDDQSGNIPASILPSFNTRDRPLFHRIRTARDREIRVAREAVALLWQETRDPSLERIVNAPIGYFHVLHNSTQPPPEVVYSMQTSCGNFFTASGILVSNCDSLLRHRAPWMNELSLVVADEVHLLTEHERGPTLEVVLTRLTEINPNIQVLALSATVRNADEVGQWLHAGSVTTDWRPVPLREGIYNLGQLQFNDGSSRAIQGGTKTPVLDIALDVLGSGGQALIFTDTRRSAVEMGRKAAIAVKPRLSRIEERSLNTIAERVLSSGEKTRLGEALASQIAAGVGFHHAGLTGAHRGIVESAFRDGRVKVLAATPTLCLPAGEEIFGNPGPIAIEKLSSLDRVLTHGSLFENVLAPTSRHYHGPLVKVTPWFQLPMRMTPEHRVLRATRKRKSLHSLTTNRHWWTYSKPEWTKAGNLKVGDLVMFPRIKEEHNLRHIDLPIQGPLSNQAGVVGEHWSRLKVDRLELSPETLEVLGLYIAQGYTGRNGQVMFALNTMETDLTALITGWLTGIGLRSRVIDSDRHRRVVRACSKQLAELLRDLCGHEAAEKRIPHRLVLLPNNQLGYLVRGMWRGDGEITEARGRTARYSTTSRRLAKQLFAVLVKLGYMPAIRMTRRSGKTSGEGLVITHRHDLYTVSVSGKQLTQFLREVLLTKPEGFERNREFNRGYLDSDYYYMPIRRIDLEPYRGTVHNLEVEGHSSYVGSFVVHNSAGVNLPARTVIISSYERFESGSGRYPISVLEYKQFCLPRNTNITLRDGSVAPIGNLVERHNEAIVLSVSNPHGMVERAVTERFERSADELVEISTNIGRQLAITLEHPILMKGTDGRPEWTPAAQVKPGDWVAYARDIVTLDGAVHWLDFLPPGSTYVLQPISFLNRRSVQLKYRDVARKLGIKLKTFKGYMGHRRNPSLRFVLSLAEFLGIERKALASEIHSVKSKWGKPVRLPPMLDEDFMWLAGIIASDGHLKKSKSDRRGTYYQIRIFNKDERIIEKTLSILRRMGLTPSVTARGGGNRTVRVGSNLLGPLISRFGIPFRSKSLRVFVPDFMLRFPRSLIGAFLAGVFDGDGSYSETKYPRGINTKVRAIVIATGSKKFAWGIHELLLRLGIVSTVARDARALTVNLNGRVTTFPNPVYRIIIRSIADIQRFRSWARSVKQIPKIEYSTYHNVNERRDAEAKRPYAWVRVTGNVRKKLSRPIKVYNLSVEDTQTYLASNFIVHNCGRAGRPKYDKYGESVLIARNQDEADWLMENYVIAQPEKLWSKLAVERILRPHVLSTVAAGYAKTEEGLYEFFGRTFYAHQYGPRMIKGRIGEVLKFLSKEEMVVMEGRNLEASRFGKRVSELYIDPMSAVIIRDGLYNRAKKMTDFSLLHLISRTPDLAPRPRPRGSEMDKLGIMAESQSDEIMGYVPNQFEDPIAYDEFLSEIKASLVLSDWISEFTEDQILETRKVEPGDLLRLVQGTEWLVFAAQELARLFGHKDLLPNMEMLRVRVSKGVKPELVKLVGLEGVGRVRARMIYSAGLKSIDDIKERSLTELTSIPTIGPSLAKRIKEQAGGLIKADEWEKAKSTKPAEAQQQIVLTEYEDRE